MPTKTWQRETGFLWGIPNIEDANQNWAMGTGLLWPIPKQNANQNLAKGSRVVVGLLHQGGKWGLLSRCFSRPKKSIQAMQCFWSIDEQEEEGELPDLCSCSMDVVEETAGSDMVRVFLFWACQCFGVGTVLGWFGGKPEGQLPFGGPNP